MNKVQPTASVVLDMVSEFIDTIGRLTKLSDVTGDSRPPGQPAVSDQQQPGRRDDIMAAAKKVFARNGFHGTTIADVAKEAQLPFESVYQYFDSKDALFGALIAAEGYALRTRVAVALAESGATVRLRRGAVSGHVAGRYSSSSTPTGRAPNCSSGTPSRKTSASTSSSAVSTSGGSMTSRASIVGGAEARRGGGRPASAGGFHAVGADRRHRASAADHRRRRHARPKPPTSSSRWS